MGAELSRVTLDSVEKSAPCYSALSCTTGTGFSLRAFVPFSFVPIALPRSVLHRPRTVRAMFFLLVLVVWVPVQSEAGWAGAVQEAISMHILFFGSECSHGRTWLFVSLCLGGKQQARLFIVVDLNPPPLAHAV